MHAVAAVPRQPHPVQHPRLVLLAVSFRCLVDDVVFAEWRVVAPAATADLAAVQDRTDRQDG